MKSSGSFEENFIRFSGSEDSGTGHMKNLTETFLSLFASLELRILLLQAFC